MTPFSIKNVGDRVKRLHDHATLMAGQTTAGLPVPVHLADDGSIAVSVMAGLGDASAANQLAFVAAPLLYREPAQGVTKATVSLLPCSLFGYNFINPNTYPVYAQLYNSLIAGVTVGTTVPRRTLAIPAGGIWVNENAGVALTAFSTGMVIAITKFADDTDNTALLTPVKAEVFYK